MNARYFKTPSKTMMTFSILVNSLAILFFALSLTIDSGYSYATVLLVLLALGSLPFYWRRIKLNRYHYYIISAFVLMSLVGFINAWRIQSTGTEYNFPTRYLVSILLFVFLSIFPAKKEALLWGIALAGIGAGITAYYYTYYAPELLPTGRAARFMNPIQFGNISILMAMLSLIGFAHLFFSKQQYYLQVTLFAGLLGGLTASILSLSRGGWLAFAITFILFILFKLSKKGFKRLNKKYWLMLLSITLIASSIVYTSFGDHIATRLQQTNHSWQLYKQGNSNTSLGTRLDMWNFAWHEGLRYPIFGANPKQMMLDKAAWVDMGNATPTINQFGHLHNEYLDAFAIKGLFGLVALLWLFIAPIITFLRGREHLTSWRNDANLLADLGLGLVVMYMGFGLTQVSLTHHSSGFMMFVLPLCFIASSFLYLTDRKKNI